MELNSESRAYIFASFFALLALVNTLQLWGAWNRPRRSALEIPLKATMAILLALAALFNLYSALTY